MVMKTKQLVISLCAFVLPAYASLVCDENTNITYTDGSSLTIPPANQGNSVEKGTQCSWKILIPNDKYVEIRLNATFSATAGYNQVQITSDYGINYGYSDTAYVSLEILPSVGTIQMNAAADGNFRFILNWFDKQPPPDSMYTYTVQPNDIASFNMRAFNSYGYNAIAFNASDKSTIISLAASKDIDEISRNVWVYDSYGLSGRCIGTLYDARRPLNSSQPYLTIYYASLYSLKSSTFIGFETKVLDQFSSFEFDCGRQQQYSLSAKPPLPSALAYLPTDQQHSYSLVYINFYSSNTAIVRVYQGLNVENSQPLAVYSRDNVSQLLAQEFPTWTVLTVTLDTGSVSLNASYSASSSLGHFYDAPFTVRDKRQGHIFSGLYGKEDLQHINYNITHASTDSNRYKFTYSFFYPDAFYGVCTVSTNEEHVVYVANSTSSQLPTSEQTLTGSTFSVVCDGQKTNGGLDVQFRMDLNGAVIAQLNMIGAAALVLLVQMF